MRNKAPIRKRKLSFLLPPDIHAAFLECVHESGDFQGIDDALDFIVRSFLESKLERIQLDQCKTVADLGMEKLVAHIPRRTPRQWKEFSPWPWNGCSSWTAAKAAAVQAGKEWWKIYAAQHPHMCVPAQHAPRLARSRERV